jgi:hypothetical protein
LNGPEALLAAVIAQAALDAEGNDAILRRDAFQYFTSPIYKHHLSQLGLDVGLMPIGMGTAVAATLPIVGHRKSHNVTKKPKKT